MFKNLQEQIEEVNETLRRLSGVVTGMNESISGTGKAIQDQQNQLQTHLNEVFSGIKNIPSFDAGNMINSMAKKCNELINQPTIDCNKINKAFYKSRLKSDLLDITSDPDRLN